MTAIPELTSVTALTSAEYLAQRVRESYQILGSDKLNTVESLYTDDVYFEDPSRGIQGKTALLDYFSKMFRHLEKCSFRFHQSIINDTDIFMSWTLFIQHSKLQWSESIHIEGASHLKTRNGRIYFQRNYFDGSGLPREQLPLTELVARKIRRRLQQ